MGKQVISGTIRITKFFNLPQTPLFVGVLPMKHHTFSNKPLTRKFTAFILLSRILPSISRYRYPDFWTRRSATRSRQAISFIHSNSTPWWSDLNLAKLRQEHPKTRENSRSRLWKTWLYLGGNLSEHYKKSPKYQAFQYTKSPIFHLLKILGKKTTSGGAMVIYNGAKIKRKKHLKQIQAYVETNPN